MIVACPGCGQKNRVPDDGAGKKVLCGRCRAEIPQGRPPVALSDASFEEFIRQHDRVVVDFWAAWCGPCRVLSPLIEELALAHPAIRVAKMDVDANPAVAARYRVSSIPTVVFLRHGEESGRQVGAVPRSVLEDSITRWLG